MSRRIGAIVVFALLLNVYGGFSVSAQTTTGRISGTVTDESGAVIPGVEITVRNPATGLTRNVITNESGTYQVPLLPPAGYTVEAALSGFRTETRSGITLAVEAVVRVDFALRVGDVSDKIEVVADAPLIQSETATLGQVMDGRKVSDIPLNARHFMRLTVLTTGVLPDVEGGDRQSPSFYANGARRNDNNFLLDGVDNNDGAGNAQLNIIPSIDAIQEFKISTTAYGAELGRAAGGVLNVQTKSGTNEFHAVAFEFLRNDIFDARNFFAATKQPYRRNQFGTVISGPVVKDKTFYMFNYEGNRIRRVDTKLGTVPTVKQRAGDFSDLGRTLTDPLTGQAFPGNIIPSDRISPIGRAIAAFYPEPNAPGANNYLANAKAFTDYYIITTKVDHRLSEKQNLSGRFTYQDVHELQTNFDSSASLPKQGNVFFQPIGRNAAISDTYVFGPRVVNEFRIGFNRLIGGIYEELYGGDDYAKQIGIKGVQSQLYPHPKGYNFGWPRASLAGYTPIGTTQFNAQLRIDNTWHWFDMLAVTRGNHQMKMGGDLRTLMLNVYIEGGGSPNGSFTFDNRYTGNSFANLLLGYPAQTQRQIGDAHDQHRWRAASAFFQDDWKVTPQLTVNLGVRWEVQTSAINVLKDEGAGLAVFDVATRQVVIAGAHGPQTFRNPIDRSRTITLAGGGDLSIPEGLYFTPLTDFAPRFGFAWSPEGLNMVVRGGYGIYYSPEIGTLTFNHRVSAYPWNIPQTFNADATRPNIFLSDPFPDALALSSITTSAIPTDFRHGYMQNWSLSIQRPLGTDTVLDVGYVGSKGTKMLTSRDINQPFLGPGSIDSRRPIPGWSGITMRERTSNSNYHSMQTKIERRFAGGLTFVSAYTLAHSIDDDSPNQDFYNRSADRGDSSFDVRHRLVNSYSYELPFGPGKRFLSQAGGVVSKIFGGWQLAGITTFSTGQSITPMVSGDISLTGKSSVRANRVGDGVLARDQRNASRWFDTSAFVIPATGTFGNAGRNTLKAPGLNNWDVTLTKNTRIGENHRTEFRVEFFNALNHAQFALPNTTVNSSAFGTITRAKDGRQIQFGLKLYY